MQLTIEAVAREDGRLALFCGDRFLTHVEASTLGDLTGWRLTGHDGPAVGVPDTVGDRILRGLPELDPHGADWPTLRENAARLRAKLRDELGESETLRRHPVKVAARRRVEASPARPTVRLTRDARKAKQAEARRLLGEGLTMPEVADRIGVRYKTLFAWKQKGKLGRVVPVDPSAPRPRRRGRPPGPRQASGPTLATLDTSGPPPAALKTCPACGVLTAARYCPNGHDIYLDGELSDDAATEG